LAAYSEAIRCLNKKAEKGDTSDAKALRRITDMQDRLRGDVEKIRRFIDARKLYESDPGESMRLLDDMSKEKEINDVVRIGDMQTIAVLHNVKRGNFKKALQLVEKCQESAKISMRKYLGDDVLNRICDENGVPRPVQHALNVEEDQDENGIEYSHAMRRLSSHNGRAGDNEDDDE